MGRQGCIRRCTDGVQGLSMFNWAGLVDSIPLGQGSIIMKIGLNALHCTGVRIPYGTDSYGLVVILRIADPPHVRD